MQHEELGKGIPYNGIAAAKPHKGAVMAVVFPWYLFGGGNKSDATDKEMVPKIHQMAKDKIAEEKMTAEEQKRFIDKINELFRKKIGADWKNIQYDDI
jgi:hypothetical protein